MARVVACYKWVIDESDIRIGDDLDVDVSRAKMKISDYDRNAIEAAVRVAGDLGAETAGLTLGGEGVEKSAKEALSRGLDCVTCVLAESAEIDSRAAAVMLAGRIVTMDDVELVVCADGSSDQFARQMAPRIAAILDWPCVTSAIGTECKDGSVAVKRLREGFVETIEVKTPAVISVLPEICEPRIPGLKAIMAAKKKPCECVAIPNVEVPAPKVRVDGIKGYSMVRKNILIDGDADEMARKLVDDLRKEGVIG